MNSLPQESIALFIDGPNLHSSARAFRFDIDYRKLLALFGSQRRLVRAFHYTALMDDQEYSPLRPLVDWLDYNGYRPMLALRDAVPRGMPLRWAEFATPRQKLLKSLPPTRSGGGARAVEKAARIRIHFASACPDAALFRMPAGRLAASGP